MKKRSMVILLSLLVILLVAAAALVFFLSPDKKNEKEEKPTNPKLFSYYTEEEVFQDIPVPSGEGVTVGRVEDYGAHNYVADVEVLGQEDYEAYLKQLEQAGFKKYVDNSASEIVKYIDCATYTKNNLVVTTTYTKNGNKIYISAAKDLPLSKKLFETAKDTSSYTIGAKNTLHMLEPFNTGNSFLLQLKNGHFVMSDGGTGNGADLNHLIDYMEALTPDGEKPVIEGWFVTHAHGDHGGVFQEFQEDKTLAERIYVEEIYFSEVSKKVEGWTFNTGIATVASVKLSARLLKDQEGQMTQVYRPHTGERYYFGDVTIDIVHTQEQLLYENYYQDLNDSSTWTMYNIDGQRFLNPGDSDYGSMEVVMFNYDEEYFDVDIYSVSHHGINVADTGERFTEYMNYDVALYTSWRVGSQKKDGAWGSNVAANKKLIEKAKECFSYGNGTVILEFPYVLGSGKMLGCMDWTQYTFDTPWQRLDDKSPYYVRNY